MRLTVLGSGTGVPRADRGGPGHLVQAEGVSVLMDLGMGTLAKLQGLGVSLADVGPILVTHLHPDHTAELVSLLFALRNLGVDRRKPLVLMGGAGLRAWLERLFDLYGDWIRPRGYELVVEEIAGREETVGALRIAAVGVEHIPGSVGFRITGPRGEILAYSGDAASCPGLLELARAVDLALFEASFPETEACAGHLSAAGAAEAAAHAGARYLLLTHFYPEWGDRDPAAEAAEIFGPKVTAATDLLTMEI